jgi:hypothetical protein
MLKHEVGGLGGECGEVGEFGGPRPGCPCPGWGGPQWRKGREMEMEMEMEMEKKRENRGWKQNGRRGAAA